jgi:cytochrome c-type biogenesis protein CcmE
MVDPGSLRRAADGVTVHFSLNDGERSVPVEFRGILPDLFRENSGAVAEGALRSDGTFVADNILAKHDERYMPPELGNQAAEHQAAKTVAR